MYCKSVHLGYISVKLKLSPIKKALQLHYQYANDKLTLVWQYVYMDN